MKGYPAIRRWIINPTHKLSRTRSSPTNDIINRFSPSSPRPTITLTSRRFNSSDRNRNRAPRPQERYQQHHHPSYHHHPPPPPPSYHHHHYPHHRPPTNQPPTNQPPTNQPPTNQPPTNQPPTNQPLPPSYHPTNYHPPSHPTNHQDINPNHHHPAYQNYYQPRINPQETFRSSSTSSFTFPPIGNDPSPRLDSSRSATTAHHPNHSHHTHSNRHQQPQYETPQQIKKRKDHEKKLKRLGIFSSSAKSNHNQPYHDHPPHPNPSNRSAHRTPNPSPSLVGAPTQSNSRRPSINPQRQLAIPSVITVAQLAQLTHQKLHRLQSLMRSAGLLDTRPDRILTTDDTAYLVLESGFEPIVNESLAFDIYPDPSPTDRSHLPLRPPVVCIMGHVDHGKTTLLDSLRKSSIAKSEAGGITQHLGAFELSVADLMPKADGIAQDQDHGPRTITFLDTPGHAAFSAMRSRGAMSTDVAVIVVAADDGVKPQTKEVIQLVQQTDVGIVVAITKCDKPSIDVHRTKAAIYAAGIEIEGLGGEVPCVEVSALTGQGLAELAETILAVAVLRDLRAEPDGVRFEGRVIESDVERGHGHMASVITLRGNLHVGLDLIAGRSYGRVRQLISTSGQSIPSISPGRPVRVTGWKTLPEAGSLVLGVESEERAKRAYENRLRRYEELELSEQIQVVNDKRAQAKEAFESSKSELEGLNRRERIALLRERNQRLAIEAQEEQERSGRVLNVILKADYTGTVEALQTAIEGLGNSEVRLKIVRSGVGNVTESDARMAFGTGSTIVGFNVKLDPSAARSIEQNRIEYSIESIIYRSIDYLTGRLVELLPKRFKQRVLGQAKILQVFEIQNPKIRSIKNKVAGARVTNGEIKSSCSIKILRNKQEIWRGMIKDLKQGKKETSSVSKGQEFGISFQEDPSSHSSSSSTTTNSSSPSIASPEAHHPTTTATATTSTASFEGFQVDDEILGLDLVEIPRTLDDGL